jgi:putative transposase
MNNDRGAWNLPAPPGFQGLREDLPLEVYQQALPHWRQDGATYFVRFRLHDSLPQAKLAELRAYKAEWEMQYAKRRGLKSTLRSDAKERDEMAVEIMRRVETWLDQGMGSCCLKVKEAARKITDAMHETDGARCELDCHVVMPNHVHAVVRPLNPATDPLEKVLQSWKESSSRWINELFVRSGTFWQWESFDRIIRDEEHLWRVIRYVGANPRKAGLPVGETPLWIRPEWVALGWRLEETGD